MPSGPRQEGRGAGEAACTGCARTARGTKLVPTCPACGTKDHGLVEGAVARDVLRDGSFATHCLGCRQVTFVFEPDMVCSDCLRLLPDLNERLRKRFGVHGPGSTEGLPCIGCGFKEQTPDMEQVVECPHCPEELVFAQDDFPRQGAFLSCTGCGRAIRIPPTVWCPDCGLNFRRQGIDDLVRKANA